MKYITLTNGTKTLVDEDMFEYLNQFSWNCTNKYAGRCCFQNKKLGLPTSVYMHRIVIGAKSGESVDHINRDKLDNRRSNLRLCNHSQNQANRDIILGSSGYKGVVFDKTRKKYRVSIIKNKKRYMAGQYSCPIEAAKAYNRLAIEHFGEFACLNIIP